MNLLAYILGKKYTDAHNTSVTAHNDVREQLSDIGKVYDTNGEAMVNVWIGSQAEYDAIDPKVATVLYLIEEAVE